MNKNIIEFENLLNNSCENLMCNFLYQKKNGFVFSLKTDKNENFVKDFDLNKIYNILNKKTNQNKSFNKLGYRLSYKTDKNQILLTVNFYNKLKINDNICLDLDDTKEKTKVVFSVPVFNIPQRKWLETKIVSTVKYARLIATNKMIVKGKIIEPETKGAYVEISNNAFNKPKASLKIGENSWVEGSFMGTECHPSFIEKHVVIGDKTLIGQNSELQKNVVIGNNCKIGAVCKFGKYSVVGDNSQCVDLITGPKTFIGDNTNIGIKSLDGKTAIGASNYIGITPNYWEYYWWDKNREPKHLDTTKTKFSKLIKRMLSEKFYKTKETRIGTNVSTDRGLIVESGVTIGDNAKIGYNVKVPYKKEIENNMIVQDNTLIK